MRQVLLIVDVQSTFSPPEWLVEGMRALSTKNPTIASIELHDEQVTKFQSQLGWSPASKDESLVETDRVFVKHGYGQTVETIKYIKELGVESILVCGIQTETCVLAAGFALFGADLTPTLVTDLTGDKYAGFFVEAKQVQQAEELPKEADIRLSIENF